MQKEVAVATYDRIGAGYDATRRADPTIAARLIHHLQLRPGERCLDLACGTGNYTTVLSRSGFALTGLDNSRRMLTAALAKDALGRLLLVDAAVLPLRTGSFAGALCTLAVHHFPALQPVFGEVYRVLRRGRFVIFTQDHAQLEGAWLRHYFPTVVQQALAQLPNVGEIVQALQAVGFASVRTEPYEVGDNLRDLFLYSGKHRPELYLDPRVRAGISAFATADPVDVGGGCERLAADIRSGRIAEVMTAARHFRGDYTFIVATKV